MLVRDLLDANELEVYEVHPDDGITEDSDTLNPKIRKQAIKGSPPPHLEVEPFTGSEAPAPVQYGVPR